MISTETPSSICILWTKYPSTSAFTTKASSKRSRVKTGGKIIRTFIHSSSVIVVFLSRLNRCSYLSFILRATSVGIGARDYGVASDDYEGPPIFDDDQFEDELEMGDDAFVLIGKEVAPNSEILEAMFPLLEEFSDVFHDELLDASPPLCDIQHHIDLEPSSQLPNRPHYRLLNRSSYLSFILRATSDSNNIYSSFPYWVLPPTARVRAGTAGVPLLRFPEECLTMNPRLRLLLVGGTLNWDAVAVCMGCTVSAFWRQTCALSYDGYSHGRTASFDRFVLPIAPVHPFVGIPPALNQLRAFVGAHQKMRSVLALIAPVVDATWRKRMGLMRFRLLGSFKSSLRDDTCPSIMLLAFWLDVPSFKGVIGSGPAILGHLGRLNNGKPVEKTKRVSLASSVIPGPSSGYCRVVTVPDILGNGSDDLLYTLKNKSSFNGLQGLIEALIGLKRMERKNIRD
nr:putative reverse transcriptase domain-containing protein [Tanacetum cinerariifolium]